MTEIKAITISQPFASLIASGEKWIENRTWPTAYRGPLAIHAGKGKQYLDRHELITYPTGCVIAIAKLVACVDIRDIRSKVGAERKCIVPGTNKFWSELQNHKHAEGPLCWVLEDVVPIEHVTINGAQGLWNWERPS